MLAFKTEPLEHILHHYLNFCIRLGWDAKIKINCAQVPKLDHSFMLLAWDSSNAVNNAEAQENVVANFVQTLFTDRDGEMKTTGMAAGGGSSTEPQTNQEPSFLWLSYLFNTSINQVIDKKDHTLKALPPHYLKIIG